MRDSRLLGQVLGFKVCSLLMLLEVKALRVDERRCVGLWGFSGFRI